MQVRDRSKDKTRNIGKHRREETKHNETTTTIPQRLIKQNYVASYTYYDIIVLKPFIYLLRLNFFYTIF